jgi:hypothetical protein
MRAPQAWTTQILQAQYLDEDQIAQKRFRFRLQLDSFRLLQHMSADHQL